MVGIIDAQVPKRHQGLSCGQYMLLAALNRCVNTSSENIEAVEASPYHFITSVTVTHHADLLSVPLSKFSSFADPRLEGMKAFRTQKELWVKRRAVVIIRSCRLLEGQIAGINGALRKKRSASCGEGFQADEKSSLGELLSFFSLDGSEAAGTRLLLRAGSPLELGNTTQSCPWWSETHH